MKEKQPKKEDPKEKLSLHLTGQENASPDEMNAAVDWMAGDDSALSPLELENRDIPSRVFLQSFEKNISNWEKQIKGLEIFDLKTALVNADVTLKNIEDMLKRYERSWATYTNESTNQEKEMFEINKYRIGILTKKLKKFLRKYKKYQ
ncbi:MAG: hypothetical protein WCT44_01710 [Candidatus Paceibacterota bacterium]